MSLKIAANKKIAVLLAFCSRLLCATVVAAGICQVAFLNAKMSASSDPSLDIWPVAICTQLLENLSIVTACTVYLKPFLDSLESGFIQVGDLRRQNAEGYGYTHNKNSEILSSIRGKVSNQASLPQAYRLQDRRDIMGGNTFTHAHAFASAGDQMEPGDWDANSRSQILQTRTWTVQGSDLEDGMGVAQN
ncbi:MAG: hypothetical protein MMC33_004562 [Icmadophila ericetorum]|nr:hypothetical protein [Icmadophila ericetorum]